MSARNTVDRARRINRMRALRDGGIGDVEAEPCERVNAEGRTVRIGWYWGVWEDPLAIEPRKVNP